MAGRRATDIDSARRNGPLAMLGILVLLPAAGAYALHARRHGGHPPAVPIPSIRVRPAAKTTQTSALFRFVDRKAGVKFQCSLDRSAFKSCSSPTRYGVVVTTVKRCPRKHRNAKHGKPPRCTRTTRRSGRLLALGSHTFRVRARTRRGKLSRPASYTWVIESQTPGTVPSPTVPTPTPVQRFSISGSPSGSLYPGGPALPIPLTLYNPNAEPLEVTSLTVSVAGSPPGCESASNIGLTQSSASQLTPVVVPADGSVTLPAQGVTAPTVRLVELPSNQDACKEASFPLSYSGSAHS